MDIFIVIIMAFTVGFGLIFATSLSKKKPTDPMAPPIEGQVPSYNRFVRICRDMVDAMKLATDSVEENQDEVAVDIYAHDERPITGSTFLIRGELHEPDHVITAASAIEFSNVLVQARISKGIYISTGKFSPELTHVQELAPIEFIDGQRLQELADEHKIPLHDTL